MGGFVRVSDHTAARKVVPVATKEATGIDSRAREGVFPKRTRSLKII